ncbi:hypothetical protein FQA39_LY10434 [Lamprigera yunnana]|nr:hypothetical protein FQA39_LY10434 [Lamprigera yunnana]
MKYELKHLVTLLISTFGLRLKNTDGINKPNHTYLVAINKRSDDDGESEEHVCSGTIISERLVLADDKCVNATGEWLDLEVRSGSAYWSKLGKLHKVKQVIRIKQGAPVGLEIEPRIVFDKFANPVNLSKLTYWTTAETAFWNNANKCKIYRIEQWSKHPCRSKVKKKGLIESDISCNVTDVGSSLVVDGVLIGFHIGVCPSSNGNIEIFLDFQTGIYATWLKYLVKNKQFEFNMVVNKTTTSINSIYSRNCNENRQTQTLNYFSTIGGDENEYHSEYKISNEYDKQENKAVKFNDTLKHVDVHKTKFSSKALKLNTDNTQAVKVFSTLSKNENLLETTLPSTQHATKMELTLNLATTKTTKTTEIRTVTNTNIEAKFSATNVTDITYGTNEN